MACSCFFGALCWLMSGEIGRRRFHQSRPRWSHCCRPFHMRKRKRNIIRSLYYWANVEPPPPIQTHTFFHTNRKGKKKEERKAISSSIFSLLFFFRVDFCVIFFVFPSLFLSLPSISRWRSQLTWRRREKRRKRTVVAVVSRWIFLAFSLSELGMGASQPAGRRTEPCRQVKILLL